VKFSWLHLLHLAADKKESEAAQADFFRNLISRDMRAPTPITTDEVPGMIKVTEAVLNKSVRSG
jgi:hypothetical protein